MDVAVAQLAERQRGLVTRAQLLELGWSSTTIGRRLADGTLHRLHPRVYVVGHRVLAPRAHLLAAVLACGPDAVLSHRSAAAVHGLITSRAARIDVTVPGDRGRRVIGVGVHRSPLLCQDRTVVDDLKCTSVARTLLDIAPLVGPRVLDAALDRAEHLRVFDLRSLHDVLGRNEGHRGRGLLRAALERTHGDAGRSRSVMELWARNVVVEAGLPVPSMNVVVEGYELDFAWLSERVGVEVDGWQFHRSRRAFEDDRLRDRRLMRVGWRVVRVTWRQLESAPELVAADVAEVLGLVRRAQGVGVESHTA